MKEIKLSQGKVALVDDEDYELVIGWNWYCIKNRSAKSTRYYAVAKINKGTKQIFMHRLIMNPVAGLVIDHIDHNGLNNQKSNLRICNHRENCKNRTSYGESKYLGVTFYHDKHGKRFIRAAIRVNDKQIYLGTFKTEIEAAKAYDIAALKYHGGYANLNLRYLRYRDNIKSNA